MEQGRPRLECVTQDKDKTLKVGTKYEILDYFYCGNELLVENEHGYIKWYPISVFGYSDINDLFNKILKKHGR